MHIPFITKKYPALSWTENFLSGHLNITRHVTIFGENAMNWKLQIYTKKYGVVTITLPTWRRIKKGDWYISFSPDGTPQSATFYIGYDKIAAIKAKIRYHHFGHGTLPYKQGKYGESGAYQLNDDMDSILHYTNYKKLN